MYINTVNYINKNPVTWVQNCYNIHATTNTSKNTLIYFIVLITPFLRKSRFTFHSGKTTGLVAFFFF